ncbi:MAG: DUF2786 domain-containing protein [Lachnospiraceae bacterium]|nr:DUF2786 domain-containing protein [Lachnospiraceae bacterium]
MEKSDIEKKIEKLLALAESSNPYEARDALLKAQELMLKHNTSPENQETENKVITISIKTRYSKHNVIMAEIVAANFRTKVYMGKGCINIMGFSSDAMASQHCIEYLIKEIDRCFNHYIEVHLEFLRIPLSSRTKTRLQWKDGFVYGLREAFENRKADPKYALMLTAPTEVLNEYNKLKLYTRNYKQEPLINNEAFISGYEDGKRSLNGRSLIDGSDTTPI